MKNITISCLLVFCPLFVQSQISIKEFRELEKKVNNLEKEKKTLEALEERISSLESKIKQANRTSRNRNSSTKKNLEEKIATQESSISIKLSEMQTQIDSSFQNNERKIDRAILESERKMKKAISQLDNTLPIGSIVPYHLDPKKLPNNWVLCQGQKITDSESIYNGDKVPYLKGYFIRGKKNNEENGAKGGDDIIPSHSHSIPSHKHGVGNHTHSFSDSFYDNPNIWSYDYGYGVKAEQGGTLRFIAGSSKKSDLKKTYSVSGITGNASSGYTANGGGGTSGPAGSHSNVPKYKAYNYIIKIK